MRAIGGADIGQEDEERAELHVVAIAVEEAVVDALRQRKVSGEGPERVQRIMAGGAAEMGLDHTKDARIVRELKKVRRSDHVRQAMAGVARARRGVLQLNLPVGRAMALHMRQIDRSGAQVLRGFAYGLHGQHHSERDVAVLPDADPRCRRAS